MGETDDREFQPTLPHGERRGVTGENAGIIKVSTHAPARGATG